MYFGSYPCLVPKTFDPSDRSDVPWPVDPIFGTGNFKGVGAWITHGSNLSTM
jgi:hypothetical protein